jgi:hypothetical protein
MAIQDGAGHFRMPPYLNDFDLSFFFGDSYSLDILAGP